MVIRIGKQKVAIAAVGRKLQGISLNRTAQTIDGRALGRINRHIAVGIGGLDQVAAVATARQNDVAIRTGQRHAGAVARADHRGGRIATGVAGTDVDGRVRCIGAADQIHAAGAGHQITQRLCVVQGRGIGHHGAKQRDAHAAPDIAAATVAVDRQVVRRTEQGDAVASSRESLAATDAVLVGVKPHGKAGAGRATEGVHDQICARLDARAKHFDPYGIKTSGR